MFEKEIVFVMVYDPTSLSFTESKQYIYSSLKELNYYSSYILLIVDYFAIYIPKFWILRFHYLKNLLKPPSLWKSTDRLFLLENGIEGIDLTEDMYNCLYKTEHFIDFSNFHQCMFHMFQGYTSFICNRERQIYRFLLPFFEFLCPDPSEMDHWRKKSQHNELFSFSDI